MNTIKWGHHAVHHHGTRPVEGTARAVRRLEPQAGFVDEGGACEVVLAVGVKAQVDVRGARPEDSPAMPALGRQEPDA